MYPGRTAALVLLREEPNIKERSDAATQKTNRLLLHSLSSSFPEERALCHAAK